MKVSVIIPAYNHESYIADTIQSVLGQSFADFELLIINDGSTDNTEGEILKFVDERITYLSQENSGAHSAINRGISLAKGEYISILNSDDIYHPDRLKRCSEFMDENSDISVVMTEVEGIGSKGSPLVKKDGAHIKAWLSWYSDTLNLYDREDFLLLSFARNIMITTSNCFVRKAAFDKVGKFNGLRYAHDWDMLLRLASQFKVYLMRDHLLKYRIHESSTVLEDKSESKVRFEVNWLIARNIRHLQRKVDVFELRGALNKNHYISKDLLSALLMISDASNPEELLDFNNPMTTRLMELL